MLSIHNSRFDIVYLIIDEAQRYPNLFQEIRGVIDGDRNRKNRFILTGSSSLELIKNVSETLAGQVDIIELGTFKTNEYFGLELPGFYHIFKQKITEETKEVLKQHKTSTTSKISLTFYYIQEYLHFSKNDLFYF
ncbi:MAG: AAA family ATPase [Deltaproteobacteria bacterium]|nr:AAA family ATPase [Deltaproteobacteria bacterium]MBT4525270.1 AAA family ATPase [Deltaproteobacteria bacterium]